MAQVSPTLHALFSPSCGKCPWVFLLENSYLAFRTLLQMIPHLPQAQSQSAPLARHSGFLFTRCLWARGMTHPPESRAFQAQGQPVQGPSVERLWGRPLASLLRSLGGTEMTETKLQLPREESVS